VLLLVAELSHGVLEVFLLPHVAWTERDDLPATAGLVRLGCVLEHLEAPADDVYLGPVGGKGLGGHQADSCSASGDDAYKALDAE
jgi:hypothetical protein